MSEGRTIEAWELTPGSALLSMPDDRVEFVQHDEHAVLVWMASGTLLRLTDEDKVKVEVHGGR